MRKKAINDTELLMLVNGGMSQAQAAKKYGVSPAAVCKRLKTLRGRQVHVVAQKKIEEAASLQFDVLGQLVEINTKTLSMLEGANGDPELALKCVAEVRQQLRLAADLYSQLHSIEVVNRFMQTMTNILKEVDNDTYQEFKKRFNRERSLSGICRIP